MPTTPAGLFQSSPRTTLEPALWEAGAALLRRGGEEMQESRNPPPPPPNPETANRPTGRTHTFLSLCFILTVLCSRENPSSLAASVSFSSMVFKRLVFFLSVTSLSFFIKNNLKKK